MQLMAERFGVKRDARARHRAERGRARGGGRGVGRPDHPGGFRDHAVAERRDVRPGETQIVALGEENLRDARRVRAALGVGRIAVSQVASGIGDVQIIVGKDFTA